MRENSRTCVTAWLAMAYLSVSCTTSMAGLESTRDGELSDSTGSGSGGIRFEEVTEDAGIHRQGPSWGTAWGDFNGDGLPDLYESGHGGSSVLYLNQGDGTFVDESEAILGGQNRLGDLHGAAWADFDNDGDQDLFQMVGAMRGLGVGGQRLFVNDRARRKLVNRAESLGVSLPLARGRSPLWLDFDHDGLLDLFLGMADRPEARATFFRNTGELFLAASELTGVELDGEVPYAQVAHLMDSDQPNIVIGGFRYPRSIFSHGESPFAVLEIDTFVGSAADTAIADVDGDLRLDIAVARARYGDPDLQLRSPTQLEAFLRVVPGEVGFDFQTDGELRVWVYPFGGVWWKPSEIVVGSAGYRVRTMPLELGSKDPQVVGLEPLREELKELRIGYDDKLSRWSVRVASPGRDAVTLVIEADSPITGVKRVGFDSFRAKMTNELLLNRQGGFVRRGLEEGLEGTSNCGSVVAGDFDNDTDIDLYFACFGALGNLPNALYENVGDGTFRAVAGAGGASGSVHGRGDTVAIADYDLDGFLDLSVSNGRGAPPISRRGPHQLFRNRGNRNHWLGVDLVGTVSNRDGVGAQVWLTAGGLTQYREQNGGMHRGAQNHQQLHFGLGRNREAERLLIRWPSGSVQELTGVAADQVLRLVEAGAGETVLGGAVVPRSTACVGEELVFSSVLGSPIATKEVTWDLGDGSPTVQRRSPRHVYAEAGSFSVGLTIEDRDGRKTKETSVITVVGREECERQRTAPERALP